MIYTVDMTDRNEREWHLSWLDEQLRAYTIAVTANSTTTLLTKATYAQQAGKFVRWVRGRDVS